MKKYLIITLFSITGLLNAQVEESVSKITNSASDILSSTSSLTIGGYAEVDYNQVIESGIINNGKLDVHRLVMLFGYKFSDKVRFVSELEFEHVSEVFVEQAFLDIKLSNSISIRSGLLLIPVGLINEYHEPPTFNGVERPYIDSYIVPTTWREIGAGIAGTMWDINTSYQLYVVNGFNGYNGAGTLDGKNGFRKGRQKGAESIIRNPGLSGKIEFFGIKGLNASVSGYFGTTQSTLYKGLDKNDLQMVEKADSSVVGLRMGASDFRFDHKGLLIKGQYYLAYISNTEKYNALTGKDLGSRMNGWYLEAGYNVFRTVTSAQSELIPFVRYERADTHSETEGLLTANPAYNISMLTTGLTFKPASGTAVKTDFQVMKDGNDKITRYFNLGVSVWF